MRKPHSQHPVPTSFPHERHWELHTRWSLACSGMCQLLHGLHNLFAPPPSGFNRQNHKLTPARRSTFWVCGLPCRDMPARNRTAPSWCPAKQRTSNVPRTFERTPFKFMSPMNTFCGGDLILLSTVHFMCRPVTTQRVQGTTFALCFCDQEWQRNRSSNNMRN